MITILTSVKNEAKRLHVSWYWERARSTNIHVMSVMNIPMPVKMKMSTLNLVKHCTQVVVEDGPNQPRAMPTLSTFIMEKYITNYSFC